MVKKRLGVLKLKKINFATIKVLFLEDVDTERVLVSTKVSSGEKNFKYFIGYFYNDYKVKPLHIVLKTSEYVKGYDGQTEWIYFLIEVMTY